MIRNLLFQCIYHWPNFEFLDARIASALNKIIKNKVSVEDQKAQKADRFLRGTQIAYLIYDYFPVTGAHETLIYSPLLFAMTTYRNSIQDGMKFYSRCPKFPDMMSWKVCTS